MNVRFTVLLFFISRLLLCQDSLSVEEENGYREDQFYASITYNLLNNLPEGISQNEFSTGFHLGFIRDMPINKDRTWAIGLGFGISSNSYNQNLIITENQGDTFFTSTNDDFGNIRKNKFTTYLIDVPLEVRWRTSTAKDYQFWRIYTGFKFSYLVYNSTKSQSEFTNINLSNNDAFNNFQYGLTLSAGYGTWNFHIYYGLNRIFDASSKLNTESLDLKAMKIGLIFYIL
jgi:hypothetical protein